MRDKAETLVLRDTWYARAAEQTLETLPVFIAELAEVEHDYNTICYATGAAAVGAAWAMNRSRYGGVTGFQSGAVMWEFMEHWGHIRSPAWFLEANSLLYPQYEEKFTTISRQTWEWLQKEAHRLLAEKSDSASQVVVQHWRTIAAGVIPFGLTLREY